MEIFLEITFNLDQKFLTGDDFQRLCYENTKESCHAIMHTKHVENIAIAQEKL